MVLYHRHPVLVLLVHVLHTSIAGTLDNFMSVLGFQLTLAYMIKRLLRVGVSLLWYQMIFGEMKF